MLKEKKYSMEELKVVFQCNNRQQLTRKLNSYGILFDAAGRGAQCVFDIKQIQNPFKLYAVLDLNVSAQTDFNKFRDFCYYFLNDENFRNQPAETKEIMLTEMGKDISRQTIRGYESKLEDTEFIHLDSGEYEYYFAVKNTRIKTDEETYKKAWAQYFSMKRQGKMTEDCIFYMISKYGGVARKYQKPEFNGIYTQQLNYLNELVCAEMEKIGKFESDI